MATGIARVSRNNDNGILRPEERGTPCLTMFLITFKLLLSIGCNDVHVYEYSEHTSSKPENIGGQYSY
ncbi:hypothetical protein AVEN_7834-1 [Araneus ventricosus]|uniref:Uncharacterized protein n=1 Tax=Araneus ventricosus TaxID=182803 RepID=A0A4Y2F0Z4_ARAVE|nr:hypothetical protein AVEN_7834-1 [Araneus ventricosus]